jgi:hypothetical protein
MRPVAFKVVRKPAYRAMAIGPRHQRVVVITAEEAERLMRGPKPWKPRTVIK